MTIRKMTLEQIVLAGFIACVAVALVSHNWQASIGWLMAIVCQAQYMTVISSPLKKWKTKGF
jgi:hypothetical protein